VWARVYVCTCVDADGAFALYVLLHKWWLSWWVVLPSLCVCAFDACAFDACAFDACALPRNAHQAVYRAAPWCGWHAWALRWAHHVLCTYHESIGLLPAFLPLLHVMRMCHESMRLLPNALPFCVWFVLFSMKLPLCVQTHASTRSKEPMHMHTCVQIRKHAHT